MSSRSASAAGCVSLRAEKRLVTSSRAAISRHYTTGDLSERVLAGLRESGKTIDGLRPEDLELFDQFHLRGDAATRELAALAEVGAGMHVLDIGSGIGGSARTLAHSFGCRVTGIDLVEEFCRVAGMLTARTGLSEHVRFLQGEALTLPFADASFDLVWSQHVLMNVADKASIYAQVQRILKPGGRYACYEIVAGSAGGPDFPVPWASDATISHLVTAPQMRDQLAAAGFRVLTWNDDTVNARAWIAAQRPHRSGADSIIPARNCAIPAEAFRVMARNVRIALESDRMQVVQAVLSR